MKLLSPRIVKPVTKEQNTLLKIGAVLVDEVAPSSTLHGIRRLAGKVRQITLATEKATEFTSPPHPTVSSRKMPYSKGLIMQILRPMPPAMQRFLHHSLKRQLHQTPPFSIGHGMRRNDLLRREPFDARSLHELFQRTELMKQK